VIYVLWIIVQFNIDKTIRAWLEKLPTDNAPSFRWKKGLRGEYDSGLYNQLGGNGLGIYWDTCFC